MTRGVTKIPLVFYLIIKTNIMVEYEITSTPKELSAVTTEATETKSDATPTSGPSGELGEECTKHKEGSTDKSSTGESQTKQQSMITDTLNPRDLEMGDVFYGSVAHQGKNNKNVKQMGIFCVVCVNKVGKNKSKEFTLMDICGNTFKANAGGIRITQITKEQKKNQIEQKALEAFGSEEQRKKYMEHKQKQQEEKEELEKLAKEFKKKQYNFNTLSPEQKLSKLIECRQNNIWMVGPAGCGKSTMARNVAKELDIPYLCISCGIGTSATEFVGYKYPTREGTKFAEYYAKKSIILIDEMTALDPAVAQVLNAALANDEIETTTGLVHRNPECIIIATSNTFGNGADRQYVANNQLDSSTIDRFVGGIIEVSYSKEYESNFDSEVVTYVNNLRQIIKTNSLRRIASTRMIQAAHRMKYAGMSDWKDLAIINWSDSEKAIVREELNKMEKTKKR